MNWCRHRQESQERRVDRSLQPPRGSWQGAVLSATNTRLHALSVIFGTVYSRQGGLMTRTLCLLLCLPTVALADVIDDDYEPPSCPPMTCPPGSSAYSGGHGSCPVGCVPFHLECTSDAQCASEYMAGSTCVNVRFCVESRFAGRSGDVDVVVGEANAEGACETGTPSIGRRCTVPPPRPAAQEEESGCSAAGGSGSLFAVFVLLLMRRKRDSR